MPREFTRNQRLGNQVLRSLSELLRFEIKDPRLEGVSLTAVDLTRDLSVARVYYSMLDPDAEPATVQEGLDKLQTALLAKGWLIAEGDSFHPAVESVPAGEAAALWNWIYIAHEDKSLGVHNPAYTRQLIQEGLDALGIGG